ncbi:hypothetical protein GCM10007920_09670 [Ciceribacter naphthalenivorans]|uniref:LysE type translocator n=2 Tax=Alphaproteobacteria TaxID=28211 RepID=A0A512HER7_9HYPH|nr:hypothetical protein RNA01_08730 [Ciceribacter naphthalenivorans]GLR21181.1 hypothetical protein GCM10007920_09670 [Ciceribacter naphthalenivorans]GLT04037.1 hypothetical protein GCM10007926_09670 [Sphingomonas psychrolutea]
MLLEFTLTSLIVIATPGTGALYTIAMGLSHGRATALVAALGCSLGIVRIWRRPCWVWPLCCRPMMLPSTC